jgi:hypothetical protein
MAVVHRRDAIQVARAQVGRSERRASTVTSNDLLKYMSFVLILLVAGAALSIYVIDALHNRTVDSITESLLTFVVGVISTLAGVHVGGAQSQNSAQQAADIINTPSASNGSGVGH